MKLLYSISAFISCIFAYKLEGNTTDIITKTSINVTDSQEHLHVPQLNTSTIRNEKNITLTRITQPSTTIERFTEINNTKSESEFIPSPQLESYLEYNRYPVIPAFPEAKQLYSQFSYIPPAPVAPTNAIPTYNKLDNPNANHPNSKKMNNSVPSAQDKQLFFNGYEKPSESSGSGADFPSYKYYERFNYGPSSTSITNPALQNFDWYNKMPMPYLPKSPGYMGLGGLGLGHPYPFITDFTKKDPTIQTTPKVIIAEHPHQHPHPHLPMVNGGNPWKKAAKLFAAILPIGLLISALTPNILTITSTNETYKQQCRKLANRASENTSSEPGVEKLMIEKLSKPGCEARLLCETAVKEDHMNVDVVKKLFWTFVSQNAEDTETPGELEAVSKAIREKRCDRILCRSSQRIKDKDKN